MNEINSGRRGVRIMRTCFENYIIVIYKCRVKDHALVVYSLMLIRL